MKKTTRHSRTGPDVTQKRALRLAHETIKTLGSGELTQAISGCNTTSWSTEAPPNTNGC